MKPGPGAAGRSEAASSGPCNILTIDLEDWYHSLDEDPGNWERYEHRAAISVRALLNILEEYGTKATFFVLGHIARSDSELIKEIHVAGHEISSHGCDHGFVFKKTPGEFEDDVRRSKELLESITGDAVLGYRAPYFSITNESLWALDALDGLGFRYDSSIFPVFNPRYGMPGADRLPHRTDGGLLELPPSTFPLGSLNIPVAGGIYFRFLPYAVTRSLFRRLNGRGERVIFYLHPWEIDADQPRIRLPRFLGYRHYLNLDRTAGKLKRLLGDFTFGPVREVLRNELE